MQVMSVYAGMPPGVFKKVEKYQASGSIRSTALFGGSWEAFHQSEYWSELPRESGDYYFSQQVYIFTLGN